MYILFVENHTMHLTLNQVYCLITLSKS